MIWYHFSRSGLVLFASKFKDYYLGVIFGEVALETRFTLHIPDAPLQWTYITVAIFNTH